jgi:triacylglycerol lipase
MDASMPDDSARIDPEAIHRSRAYLLHPERVRVDWGEEPRDAADPGVYADTTAHWLANCSHLAYYGEAAVKKQIEDRGWQGIAWLENKALDTRSTQGFIARKGRRAVCAFRGTEVGELQDLLRDADLFYAWGGEERRHPGFTAALEEVRAPLLSHLEALHREGIALYFTGHSLGAALATLAAREWSKKLEAPLDQAAVYTFGSPRLGNAAFARRCDAAFRHYRIVDCCDIVATLPPPFGYRHCGREVFLDATGSRHDAPSLGRRWQAKIAGMLSYHRHGGPGDLLLRKLADHNIAYYARLLGRLAEAGRHTPLDTAKLLRRTP